MESGRDSAMGGASSTRTSPLTTARRSEALDSGTAATMFTLSGSTSLIRISFSSTLAPGAKPTSDTTPSNGARTANVAPAGASFPDWASAS